ncbi:Superfamily II DNA and RNA helicase [Thiothrix caldifontis]|uniref:Superfamily II DNA and RNA helicase n=1 Tax=Thiothrix caldifontis TaxID=525918 RepID=A0A1H4D745_9GAMM|nr:DEAD/DEAH box helicase [Thiothrix caldifontis]SEA68575.1 Superfamily II DNA and RNA helicase [Thiothrix caldifontis]
MSFSELGLHPEFAAKIEAAGYENPTELQKQLIPLVAQNKSVIVWTQSASGKTGAFLIPAINYVLTNPIEDQRHTRVLILTSRRDRVNQINYTIKRLMGDEQQIRSGFIVSGRPYQPQMRLLRRPLDLMIATPGRLNDLVDNNKADFSKLEMLVIDDLSAIYHKGLHGLVNKILSERTTACPVIAFVRPENDIAGYARAVLAGAEELEVDDDRNPLLQIPQVVHLADDYTHKIALMDHLLDEFSGEPTCIFTMTTKVAKALAESLANHGHTAEVASDLPAEERNGVSAPILIYADQDGLHPHFQGGEHIINFELPHKVEDYEARLQGLSPEREEAVIAVVLPRERENLKLIETFLGDSIEQCTLPGLAPLEHTSGFTPSVRVPRSNRSNSNGQRQHNSTNGNQGERGRQQQGRSGSNQNRSSHQAQGSGRNPNQQQSSRRDNRPTPAQEPASANAADRQQRKGPYGRLNGGAQRKREGGYTGGTPAPRRDQGGSYEIGSWEKPDYAQQSDKPKTDKQVVIRYKEKRRILTK